MQGFPLQVLAGLSTGAIYASLALALVMIYRATGDLNFAQGQMAMMSAFVAAALIRAGLPYAGAILLTVALSFAGGCVLYLGLVRPVAERDATSGVVLLLGIYMILDSAAGFVWGHDPSDFPSPFGDGGLFSNSFMSAHELGTIVCVLVLMGAMQAAFRLTRLGLGLRAAAEAPQSSALVGIPVIRMVAFGWGAAAAVGALAGVLVAPMVLLEPQMMAGILVYGFAGALLGGIDSPLGAALGGFLVGVAENLLGTYVIGTELKFSAALILIVAVLILRPAGLFGRRLAVRV